MKLNSRILGILMALLAIAIVISAVNAVDLGNDFKSDDFSLKVIKGVDFNETVNIGVNDMNLLFFENIGDKSSDVNSIMLFKDSSSDKKEITGFIKDLENQADKVEENDKYVVLKNTHVSHDVNVGEGIGDIFNFANDVFSDDGLNLSADGNSVSISNKGFQVSDANGEGVSISADGINVSDNAFSENVSVNVSSDVSSNVENSDYSVYLKNNAADKVVVISGNNLELLKSMAETVSFKGN